MKQKAKFNLINGNIEEYIKNIFYDEGFKEMCLNQEMFLDIVDENVEDYEEAWEEHRDEFIDEVLETMLISLETSTSKEFKHLFNEKNAINYMYSLISYHTPEDWRG